MASPKGFKPLLAEDDSDSEDWTGNSSATPSQYSLAQHTEELQQERLAPIGIDGQLSVSYIQRDIPGRETENPGLVHGAFHQSDVAPTECDPSVNDTEERASRLSQYPLPGDTTPTRLPGHPRRQQGGDSEERPAVLSQHPLVDTINSISQYSLHSPDSRLSLSQHHLSGYTQGSVAMESRQAGDVEAGSASREGGASRGSAESESLSMFGTRPSTVVERGASSGRSSRSGSGTPQERSSHRASPDAVHGRNPPIADPDASRVAGLGVSGLDPQATFDHSIRYMHHTRGPSLGDTLMYSAKEPVKSSTPNSQRNVSLEASSRSVSGSAPILAGLDADSRQQAAGGEAASKGNDVLATGGFVYVDPEETELRSRSRGGVDSASGAPAALRTSSSGSGSSAGGGSSRAGTEVVDPLPTGSGRSSGSSWKDAVGTFVPEKGEDWVESRSRDDTGSGSEKGGIRKPGSGRGSESMARALDSPRTLQDNKLREDARESQVRPESNGSREVLGSERTEAVHHETTPELIEVEDNRQQRRGDYAPSGARDEDYAPRGASDGGYAPRGASDGGYAPSGARDGDYAPSEARDGDYVTSGARDGDYAPSEARDGDYAPSEARDGDYVTSGASDGDYAPRGARDGDYAPSGARDADYAPRRARDGDYAPSGARDGDYAPRGASDGGYAPSGARDGDYAPSGARDGDYAPNEARDGDYVTSGARDGDYAPRGARDGDYAPSGARDGDYAPRGTRDGDYAPSGARDGDYAPSGARDGDYALRGARDGDSAPRGARDEDYAPSGARDGDYVLRGARDGDSAPSGARDEDYAPSGARDGDYAPSGARDGDSAPRGASDGDYAHSGARAGDYAPIGARVGDYAPSGARDGDDVTSGVRDLDYAPSDARDGDYAPSGARDGDYAPRGARDGDSVTSGARDGDYAPSEARDGDYVPIGDYVPSGARDGDYAPSGARDGDYAPSGAIDSEKASSLAYADNKTGENQTEKHSLALAEDKIHMAELASGSGDLEASSSLRWSQSEQTSSSLTQITGLDMERQSDSSVSPVPDRQQSMDPASRGALRAASDPERGAERRDVSGAAWVDPATDVPVAMPNGVTVDENGRSSQQSQQSSLSDKVAALLASKSYEGKSGAEKVPSAAGESADTSLQSVNMNTTKSDSDVDDISRITGEYRAILKDHLSALSDTESNASIRGVIRDGLSANGRDADVEIVISESGSNGVVDYDVRSSRRDSTDSDDTLDQDVRRILAKYGRSMSDSEEEGSRGGTRTPPESEDELSRRVHTLLRGTPPSGEIGAAGVDVKLASYLFDDPAQSMSLPMDLHSNASEDPPPLENLQMAKDSGIARSREIVATGDRRDGQDGSRVESRNLSPLQDRSSGQPEGAHQPSRGDSGRSSSVDYAHLEKDLDEIRVSLESLKRSDSQASRGSSAAANMDMIQKSPRSRSDASSIGLTSELSRGLQADPERSRVEAERYPSGISGGRGRGAGLGMQSLLTSGFIPLDVALDIVHGHEYGAAARIREPGADADESADRSRLSGQSKEDSPYNSGYPERGRGSYTGRLSGEAKEEEDTYVASRDSSDLDPSGFHRGNVGELSRAGERSGQIGRDGGVGGDRRDGQQSGREARAAGGREAWGAVGRDADVHVPHTDPSPSSPPRESRQMHGSFTDRVHDIMERESPTRQAYEYLQDASDTTGVGEDPGYGRRRHDDTTDPSTTSLGLSFSISPEVPTHFSPFRSVRSLFTDHLTKITSSAFDTSVELRLPPSRPLTEIAKEDILGGGATVLRMETMDSGRGTLYKARSGGESGGLEVELSLDSGMDTPTESRLVDRLRRPTATDVKTSSEESITAEPINQTRYRDSVRSATDRASQERAGVPERASRQGAGVPPGPAASAANTDRTRSISPLPSSSSLQPYRPAGSREVYYVESGTDDGLSVAMSETTVESTHPGSDDARGPPLPAHVLGTRGDVTAALSGIYSKTSSGEPSDGPVLSTIHESQSVDSKEDKKSDASDRSRQEEKERALCKTESWLNGTFPRGEALHTQRDPRDTQRDPRDTQRDPRDTQRDPRDTQRDPLNTQRDPRDSQRDPLDTQRDPKDTPRDPRDTQRDPRDTQRDPRDTQRELRDTQRDPRNSQRDPRNSQRNTRDIQRDPRDTQRDLRDTQRDPRDTQRDLRDTQRDPRDTQRDPRDTQRDPRDTQRDPHTSYGEESARPQDRSRDGGNRVIMLSDFISRPDGSFSEDPTKSRREGEAAGKAFYTPKRMSIDRLPSRGAAAGGAGGAGGASGAEASAGETSARWSGADTTRLRGDDARRWPPGSDPPTLPPSDHHPLPPGGWSNPHHPGIIRGAPSGPTPGEESVIAVYKDSMKRLNFSSHSALDSTLDPTQSSLHGHDDTHYTTTSEQDTSLLLDPTLTHDNFESMISAILQRYRQSEHQARVAAGDPPRGPLDFLMNGSTRSQADGLTEDFLARSRLSMHSDEEGFQAHRPHEEPLSDDEHPKQAYPVTPHPRQGQSSEAPAAASVPLPARYHFSDGTVRDRSPDRSRGRDAEGEDEGGANQGRRSRAERGLERKTDAFRQEAGVARATSPTNSRDAAALDKKAPLPRNYSPTRFREKGQGGVPKSPEMTQESFDSQRRYDEERLQARMKAVMATLAPATTTPGPNVHDVWESFVESRNSSVSGSLDQSLNRTGDHTAASSERLASLVRDPVQHVIESYKDAHGASFRSDSSLSPNRHADDTTDSHVRVGRQVQRERKSPAERKRASPGGRRLHAADDRRKQQQERSAEISERVSETRAGEQPRNVQDSSDHAGESLEKSGSHRSQLEQPSDGIPDVSDSRRGREASGSALASEQEALGESRARRRLLTPGEGQPGSGRRERPDKSSINLDSVHTTPRVSFRREPIEEEARVPDREDRALRDHNGSGAPVTSGRHGNGEASAAPLEGERPVKRMAWVITDETLASVPEDSTLESFASDVTATTTTTSSFESDGRVVTRTTKRHLPDDPKLLRLQHKIHKQKEKYKRELLREKQRKEKIAILERMLVERNLTPRKVKTMLDERSGSSRPAMKATSTPSRASRGRSAGSETSESTTLTVSDISLSSTMTPVSEMSVDPSLTMTSEAKDTSPERSLRPVRRAGQREARAAPLESSRHRQDPFPVSSSWRAGQRDARAAPSESSGHRQDPFPPSSSSFSGSPTKASGGGGRPECLRLREKDYSGEIRTAARSSGSRGGLYMEYDKPATSRSPRKERSALRQSTGHPPEGVPRRKSTSGKKADAGGGDSNRAQPASGKRAGGSKNKNHKEQANHLTKTHTGHDVSDNHRDNHVSRSSTRKAKTADFGQTCPTPVPGSPQKVNGVTMVTQGVQTTTAYREEKAARESNRAAAERDVSGFATVPVKSMKTQRLVSENTDPGQRAEKRRKEKFVFRAGQSGMAWFVSGEDVRPWRRPLKELQSYAASRDTWPRPSDPDIMTSSTCSEPGCGRSEISNLSTTSKGTEKLTLQEAFARRQQNFISRCRQRQRHLQLRAEERRTQQRHLMEREQLFAFGRPRGGAHHTKAHPLGDKLFEPKKRTFSKKEMKTMTANTYKRLPEVVQKIEEQKRQDRYKTNRLRAKIYKQRILNHVLNKKTAWLEV